MEKQSGTTNIVPSGNNCAHSYLGVALKDKEVRKVNLQCKRVLAATLSSKVIGSC